jgi:peptidyl-prolyl cis-trans isomerase B (cyclophilin B)
MTAPRNLKRQRQKELRRAKIEEEIRVYNARRRRRLTINLVALLVVMGVVGALILKAQEKPASKTACKATASGASKSSVPIIKKFDLDKKKKYTAVMKTSLGTINIDLDIKTSPCTVNSFVYLAKRGFYDGLKFHRLVKDFALQGGDPNGDGSGGPGYTVVDAPPALTKYTKGIVAMAKTGQDPAGTSGSQFFIVPGPGGASLNGSAQMAAEYAVLGRVTGGDVVVSKINEVPTTDGGTGEQSKPVEDVSIIKVTIRQS